MKTLIFCLLCLCLFHPTITKHNHDESDAVIVTHANSSVTLECEHLVGDHVQWMKQVLTSVQNKDGIIQHQNLKSLPIDEIQINHHRHHGKGSEAGLSKLKLEKIGASDAGTYTCYSRTHEKKLLRSWTLVVARNLSGSPSIFYEGQFIANKSVISVQEGDTITLTCLKTVSLSGAAAVLISDASTVIDWLADPVTRSHASNVQFHKVPNDILSEEAEVVSTVASRTFTLESVDRSPSPVTLTCNSETNSNSFVTIDVNYPPTFTIRRIPAFGVPVIEGMRIALLCEVERKANFGSDDLQWLKDDKAIKSSRAVGGHLLFDRIGPEDIGWYQCSLQHEGETYSSIGYFLNVKPDVSEENTNFGDVYFNATDYNFETESTLSPKDYATKPVQAQDPGAKQPLVSNKVAYEESSHKEMEDSACKGCCRGLRAGLRDLQEKLEYYRFLGGLPKISLSEDSQVAEQNYLVNVCSTPHADKIMWILPSLQALRPGGETPDGVYRASNVVVVNDTCIAVNLYVGAVLPSVGEGDQQADNEVTVLAKNRNGMSELVFKVSDRSSQANPKNLISAEISSANRPCLTLTFILALGHIAKFILIV